MLDQKIITNVVLPAWVYEDAKTKNEVMRNAYRYLNRIPKRIKIIDGIAKCLRCL